ncbi:MAG: UDP binding domain-containing protein, partial [Clostridia bacterium]|nr:UDP binding domain-containing protein [Clostridia bacterium]
NIAFMNELAMVFDKMDIDTSEVIAGMNTKWNALGFYPGLVGGHCIGVDPYYFTYRAEQLGYHSQIILSGRQVNDGMGDFVTDAAVKEMIRAGQAPSKSKVVIMGITFKENCPDIRNSKVEDIINRLKEYDITPVVIDPWADVDEVMREYGVKLAEAGEISDADCVIIAVAHNEFKGMPLSEIDKIFKDTENKNKVLVDVKSMIDKKAAQDAGYRYWRL